MFLSGEEAKGSHRLVLSTWCPQGDGLPPPPPCCVPSLGEGREEVVVGRAPSLPQGLQTASRSRAKRKHGGAAGKKGVGRRASELEK